MSETDVYSLRTDSPGSELGAPLRFWVRWLQRRDFFPTAATPWVRGEGVPWGLGLEVTCSTGER